MTPEARDTELTPGTLKDCHCIPAANDQRLSKSSHRLLEIEQSFPAELPLTT